jgi:hypothetical protein
VVLKISISAGVELELELEVVELMLKSQAVEMLVWLSEAKSSFSRLGSAWIVARFRDGRAVLW